MTPSANRFRAAPVGLVVTALAISCAEYGDCPPGYLRDDAMKLCFVPCPDGQVDDERHETCRPAPTEGGMDGATSSRTDSITARDAADDPVPPSMDGGSAPTPPGDPETPDGGGAASRPPMNQPPAAPAGPMSCAASPTPDACCPKNANAHADPDCTPRCGNGVREGKELCDGADCASTCDTSNACLVSHLTGSAATCDAACSEATEITHCKSGDGCCAKGCKYAEDTDCSKSCGDGVVDAPELCEPTSKDRPCPTTCDDGNPCTQDIKTGTSEQCNVVCSHMPIAAATSGDSCCPPGANANTDRDCTPRCGNGVVERDEGCDGNCPTTCDDGDPCTQDLGTGSPEKCNYSCSSVVISAARNGDGCCPAGADSTKDNDCSPKCGNGVRENNETCDGDCPSSCVDDDPCTINTLIGNPNQCNSVCKTDTIRQARNNDGCCPDGANATSDSDCAPQCGNDVVERGETCDGDCPSSCDAANPCKTSRLEGSRDQCNARCTSSPANTGMSCGEWMVCGENGTCEALPRLVYALCNATSQCETGLTCLDGQCSVRCDSNQSMCPPTRGGATTSCHTFHSESTGVCRADCTSATSCGPNYICRPPESPNTPGQCVAAGVPNAN